MRHIRDCPACTERGTEGDEYACTQIGYQRMVAEAASLRTQCEAKVKEADELRKDLMMQSRARNNAESYALVLESALREYGNHRIYCSLMINASGFPVDPVCDCGFSTTLSSGKGTK